MRFNKIIATVMALAVLTFGVTAFAEKEMPPKPEKMKKLSFPDFKEFKLKNGLVTVVVEHHEQPVASIYFVLRAGSSLDPEGKSSLAQFTASMLNKGTGGKNSDELAEWIESVGGDFRANATNDASIVYVDVLSEYLDVAYEFIAEVMLDPTFPEDELETERKRVKTALELQLSNAQAMADRHFKSVVYGHHPYAVQPVVETVEAVTSDDLVAFHKRNYVPNNAMLFVVGDVKTKDVKKRVKKYFGEWERGTPDKVEFTDPPERTARNISLYHRPNSVQTNLYVGHTGMRPDDSDWPAITVGNRILGDGATGRLFMILREEKGWTYGAYSNFSKPVDIGYFRATANVRTEVSDSALTEMLYQIDRIVEEPVSEKDLAAAKSYLIGNFPTTIETPRQIASQIGTAMLLGLEKKSLEDYRKKIDKVTIEDVQATMARHIHPDRLAMVLVGDATQVKDMVEPIASVILYDIEGNPMSLDDLAIEGTDFAYDSSPLKDMKATYGLKVQGTMDIGDLNVVLSMKADHIEQTSKITGMIQMQEELKIGKSFEPISYTFSMSAMGNEMSADLSFEGGSATGTIEGPDGPKEIDLEMVQGTLLGNTIDLVIATLALEVGGKYRFPSLDTQSGGLENVNIEVMGEEDLTVPAGSYATFKIRVKRGSGESFLFVTKDLPHIVVRQEMPSQQLNLVLKSLEM